MTFFKLVTSYGSFLDNTKLKTSVAHTKKDEPLKAIYKHTFKEAINILFPVVFLNTLILDRAFFANHFFQTLILPS